MNKKGKIKIYHQERGFGFIQLDHETKDVFFHIKNLPNKHILPQAGEQVSCQIINDKGKLKAENIVRLDVQTPQTSINSKRLHTPRKRKDKSSGVAGLVVVGIVVVALGSMLYGKFQRTELANQTPHTVIQQPLTTQVDSNPNGYSCDGRTHCSQMNSRQEARWFIRNCPSTKMDGNNDGEPCENDTRW